MNRIISAIKRLSYLPRLISFALKNDSRLLAYCLISILIPILDVYSMSWIIPFTSSAISESNQVQLPWYHSGLMEFLNLVSSPLNYLSIFLVISFLRIILTLVNGYLIIEITKKIQTLLSSQIFEEVLSHTKLKEIESKSIGYFIGLAGDQTAKSASVLMLAFSSLALVLNAAMYYFYLSRFSILTFYALTGFMLFSAFFMYRVYSKIYRVGAKSVGLSRRQSSTFLDALNNLRTVRSFKSEKYISRLYKKQASEYFKNLGVYEFLASSGKLFPLLILIIIVFIAALVLGEKVNNSGFVSNALVIFALSLRFLMLIGQAVTSVSRLIGEAYSCEDVISWINKNRIRNDSLNSIPLKTLDSKSLDRVSKLTVRNLKFSHTDPTKPTLSVRSLTFETGKRYAIIGPSGSGKSTLLDLLAGFYDNFDGQIDFNEIPLKEISPNEIRDRVILLNQHPGIFNTSVKENILLGDIGKSDLDVENASRLAGIWDHIQTLDNGFDNIVNYQGSDFSGGQRQRISLARVFARDPEIVLLDEATSALDAKTAELVMTNISNFCSNKILIFVTHNIEHLKYADFVYDLGKTDTP